jgi:hypothetical protein
MSLEEALGRVDLQPGQTYVCDVNGHTVEVRVRDAGRPEEPSTIPENDIMLDAWAEFPEPSASRTIDVKLGSTVFWPDRPTIPTDEDDQ